MDSYVKQTNKSELFSYVWFLWLRVNIDVLRLRVQHRTPYIYMITNISQTFVVWYDQRNPRKLAYNAFKVSGISIGLLWVFHCLDFFSHLLAMIFCRCRRRYNQFLLCKHLLYFPFTSNGLIVTTIAWSLDFHLIIK